MKGNLGELGIKTGGGPYVCGVCGRISTLEQAEREEWHYRLKGEGEEPGDREAEYLCNEHYRVLPEHEACQFVLIGYPYQPFLEKSRKNISTF